MLVKNRFTVLILLVLGTTALLMTACQSEEIAAAAGISDVASVPPTQNVTQEAPSAATHGEPVVDYSSLVDNLRAAGVSVERDGEILQPVFAVTGHVIKINGAEVQVFEYESKVAAEEEAALVSRDGGTVGTSAMSWMASPHYNRLED